MKSIKLTRNYEALVCDCHYNLVKDFKWHASTQEDGEQPYAVRKVQKVLCPCGCLGARNVQMHRVINNTPVGMQTDHINRNRLDNRCSNLKSVNSSDNNRNKGGYGKAGIKGVLYSEAHAKKGWKPWKARWGIDGNHSVSLGSYATRQGAEEAVRLYELTGKKPELYRGWRPKVDIELI